MSLDRIGFWMWVDGLLAFRTYTWMWTQGGINWKEMDRG